ncbi:DUF4124 domain-containing protein [Pseudomonas nitroreducens]|uniref:DUF4124 domain-containing protein n=1 Tax=Pseudomonas nitroreducens TaxID=46680 RepID=A0ABS0KPP2_PSENT|nr:DUF4124 domain-containing protein [Pseudomonas nitroreducens]MBG6290047.1 DUF4124 domain-containing protein [Pseudomonas nitroreducens]
MWKLITVFVMLAVTGLASAASMNKCKDAQGHITFTQQSCPEGAPGEQITVNSQSAGMLVGRPAASMEEPQQEGPVEPRGVVVVGADNSSGCGDASDREIRTATVKGKIFAGMSAKEAVQSWGKPDKINRSANGADQWVYYRGNYSAQYLYVDSNGCVTSWN